MERRNSYHKHTNDFFRSQVNAISKSVPIYYKLGKYTRTYVFILVLCLAKVVDNELRVWNRTHIYLLCISFDITRIGYPHPLNTTPFVELHLIACLTVQWNTLNENQNLHKSQFRSSSNYYLLTFPLNTFKCLWISAWELIGRRAIRFPQLMQNSPYYTQFMVGIRP